MNATYPSDVKLLSDEDLKTLSAELEEAYQSSDEDGYDYWCSDDAENRHAEMQAEMRRRWWDGLAPEEQSAYNAQRGEMLDLTLKDLGGNLALCSMINLDFDREFEGKLYKIGDTVQAKMPQRFVGVA